MTATQITSLGIFKAIQSPGGIRAAVRSDGFIIYVAIMTLLCLSWFSGDVEQIYHLKRTDIMAFSLRDVEFQRV